jgi:hypothetical protein
LAPFLEGLSAAKTPEAEGPMLGILQGLQAVPWAAKKCTWQGTGEVSGSSQNLMTSSFFIFLEILWFELRASQL